jgi:phage tail P2-like protein
MVKFSFNDLLPHSIKDDPKIKAASQCLDMLFEKHNERVKKQLIYSRIDELDEQTLDDIAWQWNLGYDNGYSLLHNIEAKRELVKTTLQLQKFKGTRWSIERIGEILDMPIEIIEWWEEEADDLEPFEFYAHIDTAKRGTYPAFFANARKLIESLKNARSHLRAVRMLISQSNEFYVGAANHQAILIYAYPEFSPPPPVASPHLMSQGDGFLLTQNERFVLAQGGNND